VELACSTRAQVIRNIVASAFSSLPVLAADFLAGSRLQAICPQNDISHVGFQPKLNAKREYGLHNELDGQHKMNEFFLGASETEHIFLFRVESDADSVLIHAQRQTHFEQSL
jgi:hypothetical protein